MRLIDRDALEKFLSDAEMEATKRKKYVFAGALNVIQGNVRNFPTIEPEPQWISVFDRLPEENQVVVALEKGKTWDCMTFEGTAEWTEDERMWKKNEAVIRIDYWMPKDSALPEPYREEGDHHDD